MVNWDSGLFKFTPVWGLTFLTAVNIVIYMDRSVVGVSITQAVVSDLTSDSNHGMGLDNSEAGLLGSIFILGYALSSPPIAASAQYVHPLFLMGAGLIVWSGATMMAGLAKNYSMLLIARAFTGVGEASFVCLAPPYIYDVAPPAKKTVSFTQMWIGIFYAAMIVGAALGFVYGDLVASVLDWRWPFIIESLIMIPFILTCLFAYKDPVFRPKKLGGETNEKVSLWTQIKELLRLRIFVLISLGYGGYAFTVGGLNFWAPDYQEKFYHVPSFTATMALGGITVLAGFSGTLVGAFYSDRRLRPLQKSFDDGEISALEKLRRQTECTTGIMWLTLGAAASVALIGALIPFYPTYLISLAISEFCIFL